MANVLLSQVEEDTLQELDRLIDFYKQNKKSVNHVTISKRQHNALKRIAKKKLDGEIYRRVGELDMSGNIYRGFELQIIEPNRRRYRNKDTLDFA